MLAQAKTLRDLKRASYIRLRQERVYLQTDEHQYMEAMQDLPLCERLKMIRNKELHTAEEAERLLANGLRRFHLQYKRNLL